MFRNKLIKILLSPLSLLYGIGVSVIDFFYKKGLLKGIAFDLPIISVGNLSVGGAGKTPHIEYLIQLLRPYLNVATLSRGYKRKTKGYLKVEVQNNAERVGDEPLQFKRKFPDVHVAVAENRTFAVPKILSESPDTQVILLDDAFQHRAINPGLNILLTEYNFPFTDDYLLPSGRLREWRSAYKRADFVVVSKCPPTISEEEKAYFIKKIKPFPHQKIFFSHYKYYEDYLESQVNSVKTLEYEDHRYFSKFDVSFLKTTFDKMESKKKVILTTEKDAMRLQLHHPFLQENKLPIFALPVKVEFHFDEGEKFDAEVKQFLLNFTA